MRGSEFILMRGNINLEMENKTKNRWSSNQEQDAVKQNLYPENIR
jgi:hypothetical protein